MDKFGMELDDTTASTPGYIANVNETKHKRRNVEMVVIKQEELEIDDVQLEALQCKVRSISSESASNEDKLNHASGNMLEMEWDQEMSLKFISAYYNKEILWNPRDPQYYSRIKKDNAWGILSEDLGMPIEKLKRKMDSLKGSYRREKARIKNRKGTGRKDPYISKWFAFESLRFLDDKDEPRMTQNNLDTVEEERSEAGGESLDEEMEYIERDAVDHEDESSLEQATPVKVFKSPAKHGRKRGNRNQSFGYLKKRAAPMQQKDQCSLFGDYIASKLRNFDPRLRAIAQHRISSAIFDLEMKMYPEASQPSQCYPSPSLSPHSLQISIPRSSTPQNSVRSLSSSPVSVVPSP